MQSTAEVTQTIIDYLQRENPGGTARLEADTNLLEDWFVDSLMIVSTVAFLEEQFGIRFQRADINAEMFRTVESLTQYVQSQCGGGS